MLSVAQSINSCALDYLSFQIVSSYTSSPMRIRSLRRYGLSGGMYLAALLDFKAFGLWLSRQNDPALICPALSEIPGLLYSADEQTVINLLGSMHPFLQIIGIKSLHAYRENNATMNWHYPLKQCFKIVDKGGITREDFIWTVIDRLADLKQASERAKHLAKYQKTQAHYLAERAIDTKNKWIHLIRTLRDDISTLAQHFPKDGIKGQQAAYALEITRGQLGLPLRVAEHLPVKAKKTLVQAIFNTFHSQVGIFNPANDSEYYSLPHRWEHRANHSAHAFVHFHQGENIGRKFGSLAEPIEKALLSYAYQPYLSRRNFILWTHVFGKLGMLYFYTIKIANAAERRSEEGGPFLTRHTAIQTLKLLSHYSGEYFTYFFDMLSFLIVDLFTKHTESNVRDALHAFINHSRGYSAAKLLLIWTYPEHISDIDNKKMSLFKFFDVPPHDDDARRQRFEIYINIMDRALVAAAQIGDVSLSNALVNDWNKRLSAWKSIVGPEWSNLPCSIQKALKGNDEGYTFLCSLPGFSNSMCKKYCDEMYGQR